MTFSVSTGRFRPHTGEARAPESGAAKRRLVAAAVLAAVIGGSLAFARTVLGPQPEQQAVRDGCTRNTRDQQLRLAPVWVYVNDGDYPASGPPPPTRWLSGIAEAPATPVLDAHPSGGDDPFSHNAYDYNINVLPDPAYKDLLGGNPADKTGNFEADEESTGRIHIERELTALPRFVWPEPGARIAAMGSWVWDCGHTSGGERTELHPYRALWVQRMPSPRSASGDSEGDLYLSTVATPAGQIAECAHKTKGAQQAYRTCTLTEPNWLDVSGDYDLTVPPPPRPPGATRLVARVVDEGSTIPVRRPRVDAGGAHLVFHLTATPGKRLVLGEEVFVGWRPAAGASMPVHLRVTFTRLLTRRSMDPICAACPNPESTNTQQVARPPGEWLVFSDVDGLWRLWPRVYPARDGSSFAPGVTQDLYVPRGRSFSLIVITHECDFGVLTWSNPLAAMAPCPKSKDFGGPPGDDQPGFVVARFASPEAALGRHVANGSTARPSTCPAKPNPRGCYQITYTVTRVR